MDWLLSNQVQRMAEQYLAAGANAAKAWSTLVRYLQIKHPHEVWDEVLAVDVVADSLRMSEWLGSEFRNNPCPADEPVLWFGIAEMSEARHMGLQLRGDRWEAATPASIGVLAQLSRLASGLDEDTAWLTQTAVALPIVTVLIGDGLRGVEAKVVLNGARERKIACGFDCGDSIRLGRVTARGFEPVRDWE